MCIYMFDATKIFIMTTKEVSDWNKISCGFYAWSSLRNISLWCLIVGNSKHVIRFKNMYSLDVLTRTQYVTLLCFDVAIHLFKQNHTSLFVLDFGNPNFVNNFWIWCNDLMMPGCYYSPTHRILESFSSKYKSFIFKNWTFELPQQK